MICFGVLPAAAGYTLCRAHMETLPLWCKATLGFFLLAGLIRLAYFNVLEEERQQTEGGTERRYYLGLPITASTLVFPALYLLGRLFPGAAPAILCRRHSPWRPFSGNMRPTAWPSPRRAAGG